MNLRICTFLNQLPFFVSFIEPITNFLVKSSQSIIKSLLDSATTVRQTENLMKAIVLTNSLQKG